MRRRAFLAAIAALTAGSARAQGAQPEGKPSPDGTRGPRVVDASGAVWTLGAASSAWPGDFQLLRNGVHVAATGYSEFRGWGTGFVVHSGGKVASTNTRNQWYGWNGTDWEGLKFGDPSLPLLLVTNARTGATAATLNAAAAGAQEGDSLLLAPGKREGQLHTANITKALTLKAADEGKRWEIDTAAYYNGDGQIRIDGYSNKGRKPLKVVIEDVVLRGRNLMYTTTSGIYVIGTEAGIDLTVRRALIANHANGILTDYKGGKDSKVELEDVRFQDCGEYTGQTHNFYISKIGLLKLTDVWSVGSRKGHLVKTRAYRTQITGGAFLMEDSQASFALDFAEGGDVSIERAVVTKGPNTDNDYFFVCYGREAKAGRPGIVDRFICRNSLFVNWKQNPRMTFFDLAMTKPMDEVVIEGNTFAGPGAEAALAKWPKNRVVQLKQIERFKDAKGRESYRVRGTP